MTLLDNLDQIEVSGLSGEFQNQLTTFQSTPEIKAALFNRGLPAEELTQVTVESLQPGRPQTILKESHDGYRRIYPTPMSCAFDLLAKEHPEQVSTHHLLEIVSRSEGVVAARMSLPIRGDYERDSSRSVVGHLFPYGSMGQIRGVSLLDTASGKPAWTRSFLDPEMGEILQVGPFDSEIILFRNQNTLLAVDAERPRFLAA